MNILYCGDNHIRQGLLISILSLLKHTQAPLQIYVLTATIPTGDGATTPLSDHTIAYLDALVKRTRPTNTVQKIDVSSLVAQTPPTANLKTIFTPSCMLRLYADQVTTLPDRLLYLDTDVICREDCLEFYDQDLTQYEVAGVLDHYGKWWFYQHWPRFDYLNSGVLLLNLAQIRQTKLFAYCRQLCQTKTMFMPDQSALNALATTKKIMPVCFNEQHHLQADTVLQHFTTSFRFFPWVHTLTVKPWEVDAMHQKLKLHDYDDILDAYEELVPNL